MKIRPYTADRANEIANLFHASVHAIDDQIYAPEQKEAWAPTPPDYAAWAGRLAVKQPFVAIINDRVAGFMGLDPDGHIDCAYTHPDFQCRGVASALYNHLVTEAGNRKLKRLYVEASIVARPFFERRGFTLLHENNVQRNGVTLINYTMEKYIGSGD